MNATANVSTRRSTTSAETAQAAGTRLGAILEDILAQLGVGLVAFDGQLQIVSRNAVAAQLLPDDSGVAAALTRTAFELPLPDWAAVVNDVLKSGRARRFDALCSMSNPRQPRYFRLVIAPHSDAAGAAAGGLLIVEDITERASMEQRLAVSERLAALGQLAARVAHELNNPLDGILRYVNLARRVAQDGSDARIGQYLDRARAGLMRMAEIVGSLLEYSRNARSGLAETSLAGLIEEAVGTFGPQAAAAGISVVCSFHEQDHLVVRGSSLFQVFCNLVKNAIEAMPAGGTLLIKTRVIGDEMVTTFEDSGVGLPADAARIFEPFFTTKPPGKGTGLGLAVCKEIVERYGGRIAAERRAAGGAVFTVRLPRQSGESSGTRDQRSSDGPAAVPG